MKQAHVYISGFVQGVGYRQFVKRRAQELVLTGWVKNLPDNRRVEAVLQGPKEKIDQMIKLFQKGPFLSEVEDVMIKLETTDEKYSDFVILHD